jgi:lipoprotein-anchoring transpeptidase ErfK/SrfK
MGRPSWAAVIALAVAVPLMISGCDADGAKVAGKSPTAGEVPVTLAITPAASAKNVPVSAEVGIKISGGRIASVTVSDEAGSAVAGQLRPDGSSWVPQQPLRYGRRYSATVVATGGTGRTETRTTSFTTMREPGSQVETNLYLLNGNTYGVGMPVVVEFTPGVPANARAAVQNRLFVATNPPQPGAWHWVADGTQALYRAPKYWQPGTKLTVRVGLEGHPMGSGRYGDEDRRASVTIGRKLTLDIDNRTKQLRVFQNDALVRTMPVSLGKASTPSSSGTMVIMDKQETTIFDTFAELGPAEGYRVAVDFAQRLTRGGEFIHAAPWSVGDQGYRNVSHGCVNLSTPNAEWLFGKTKIGDPVVVRATETHIDPGNGWPVWDMTWAEFIKGSALPVFEGAREPGPVGAGSGEAGPTATRSAATPSPSPAG